jgi:hypothetical protein
MVAVESRAWYVLLIVGKVHCTRLRFDASAAARAVASDECPVGVAVWLTPLAIGFRC